MGKEDIKQRTALVWQLPAHHSVAAGGVGGDDGGSNRQEGAQEQSELGHGDGCYERAIAQDDAMQVN